MSKYQKLLLLTIALVIAAVWVVTGGHKYIYKGPRWQLRQGLDLAGGIRVVLQGQPGTLPTDPEERAGKMGAVIRTIKARVAGLAGVTDPTVQTQGEDRVIVELPGLTEKKQALKEIRDTAQLKFYWLRDVRSDRNPTARWEMYKPETDPKTGSEIYTFENTVTHEIIRGDKPETQKLILQKVVNAYDPKTNPQGIPPLLTGEDLKSNAKADFVSGKGNVINVEFQDRGTNIFRTFTQRHIGDIVAIFLGDKILTAPRIEDPIINGKAIITGFTNLDDAQRRATFLNTGALPVPLNIIAMDSVEATLGKEVVNRAITAGIIGLGLVLLFMLLYYRLPGALADVALGIYALLTFAVFIVIGATMTLAGLAGFILSIGMAVDANILIFERLKEELKSGKTLRAAIDAGFSRAFTAILDSNVCTLITCAVLYRYTSGVVQSFAVTLALGVLISMFTAITVTRTFLHLLVTQEWAQKPGWFGLGTSWLHRTSQQLNVVGKRKWYFTLSGLIIIPGLVFYFLNLAQTQHGLKPGIEFKPGTSIQATFDRPVTVTEVTQAVTQAVPGGKVEAAVQISGGKTAFIRTNLLPGKDYESNLDTITGALKSRFGDPKDVQQSTVGPIISGELTRNAIMAVIMAAIAIVIYLSFRFAIGGFVNGLKYGTCTMIATLHDVFVIVGLFAILGYLRNWEIDTLFVTAVLTMIGFSTHDTIVVFDRIRENLRHRLRGEDYEALTNRSVIQTLSRSINTSTTVVITVVVLLILGGPIIKHFYWALLVGIISGTYSSIFNATPLLVVWEGIASRGKAAQRRRAEERPMVAFERARELKPMVEAPGDEVSQRGASASRPRVKVKPKKKKRRY